MYSSMYIQKMFYFSLQFTITAISLIFILLCNFDVKLAAVGVGVRDKQEKLLV